MKRRTFLIVAACVFGVFIAAFLALNTKSKRQKAVLPNPNGYDDFVAAAQWLVMWNGDRLALSPEGIRSVVNQNSKALETVRSGLKKQSAVPVIDDMNWLATTHLPQLAANKSLVQLLVAEGMVHEQNGRTNEAAQSFADCIVFAHAVDRRGLMIDHLVGIACQAIGLRQLIRVAPDVSSNALGPILRTLIALDQAREPASTFQERDREWSQGTYALWQSMWTKIVMRRTLRDAEARFGKRHARSVAALRLVMTELAVRLYERQNGKLPSALADLVPAYLPAVPLDPFSNRALVYRVTTNSFLLYSIGPDEKDDGGRPLTQKSLEKGDLLPTSQ